MSQRMICEVQNDLARISGHGAEIMWDSLSADQASILKEKIKTILPDDHESQQDIEKARKNLFKNVWLQRKHTNGVLLSSIVYVLVTEEKDRDLAKYQTKFTLHPLIRTRKCLSSNKPSGCCMIFIDEHSRIYQNWQQYLKENILPSGTMVAPAKGVYSLNEYDEVELEICATPSTSSMKQLDTAIGVGGLITGTAPLALSMIMPIAAPVMLTATVVSLATSAYATVRSANHLKDRHNHGQSTSLGNREARGKWLGVAGGVAGMGASGAMKALTYASSAGKGVPLAAKVAVSGLNVSSLVLSGTDIVNTFHDLYLRSDDGLNSLDILQLASSLLIFTHSINNLALVSKIPTRGGSASSLRKAICNQARNSYEKMSNGSTGLSRNLKNMGIIRIVNNIPSKEAFIKQIGMLLANAGARTTDGNAISEMSLLINNTAGDALNSINLLALAGFDFVRNILNSNSFIDLLHTMGTFMCEKSFYLLLNLTRTFLNEYGNNTTKFLNTFIPTEKVLYEMFMLCVTKYMNLSYKFLESKQTEILDFLEKYFSLLNPIDCNSQPINCKFCSGFYYESASISRL